MLWKFKDEYPLIHQFKMTTLPLLPLISMMLSRFERSWGNKGPVQMTGFSFGFTAKNDSQVFFWPSPPRLCKIAVRITTGSSRSVLLLWLRLLLLCPYSTLITPNIQTSRCPWSFRTRPKNVQNGQNRCEKSWLLHLSMKSTMDTRLRVGGKQMFGLAVLLY